MDNSRNCMPKMEVHNFSNRGDSKIWSLHPEMHLNTITKDNLLYRASRRLNKTTWLHPLGVVSIKLLRKIDWHRRICVLVHPFHKMMYKISIKRVVHQMQHQLNSSGCKVGIQRDKCNMRDRIKLCRRNSRRVYRKGTIVCQVCKCIQIKVQIWWMCRHQNQKWSETIHHQLLTENKQSRGPSWSWKLSKMRQSTYSNLPKNWSIRAHYPTATCRKVKLIESMIYMPRFLTSNWHNHFIWINKLQRVLHREILIHQLLIWTSRP